MRIHEDEAWSTIQLKGQRLDQIMVGVQGSE